MKKSFWSVLWILLVAALFAGCSADKDKPLNEGDVGNGSLNEADMENMPLNEMDVEKYVTLGDYMNLNVDVEPATVDEDELSQLILSVYHNYMKEEDGIIDRTVQIGDTVNIDYEGKKDGVAFAGGTAAGASLTIGSGEFIAGFEDGLVGVMPGETVDLDLTFPAGYGNVDLAGQAVVFTVTVNYIMPDLDNMKDSVVADMGIDGVATVEEFRQYAYDYLDYYAQNDYTVRLQNAIIDELINRSTFREIPGPMVEAGKRVLTGNVENIAAANGVTAEFYTNYVYQMSVEEFVDTYAKEGVKQDLILQAIANREGLNVSDEELQSLLEEYTANAGYASVEEFLGDASKEDFRNYLMTENVLGFLSGQIQGQ